MDKSIRNTYGIAFDEIARIEKERNGHKLLPLVYCKMTEKDWDLSEKKHTFDPGSFFSDQAHFFQYLGSLTTPPTNGPVQWFVFDGVGEMSRKFLTNFHLHVKQNARPLQALNQRNICWGNLSN